MSLLTIHTKSCLTRAIVSAVENLRDSQTLGSVAFAELVGGEYLLNEARSYLSDGTVDCRCRVRVATRVAQLAVTDGLARAQSYATAELQCGVITPEDYVELTHMIPNLPIACIHPGVFFPHDGDIDGTSRCGACGVDVPNYEL